MNKKENENTLNNNINQKILDEEFFDNFSPSKQIAGKKKKINELIVNLKENKEYLSSLLSVNNRQKLSKLYELILSNLTENNNTFVLSQLELIELLGQYLYDQNEFKSFYKQALPKLFDKFYLQNKKINNTIIEMFNNSIANRILNIEDYYPHIESIALEEDDDYKVIVLDFFYKQMLNTGNIIYEKIPKNIINIIGNLANEENQDISEISKKLMNIFEKFGNNAKNEVINNENNIINNDINNSKNEIEKKENIEEKNDNINFENKEFGNLNESNSSIHEKIINYDDFMNNDNNNFNNEIDNKNKEILSNNDENNEDIYNSNNSIGNNSIENNNFQNNKNLNDYSKNSFEINNDKEKEELNESNNSLENNNFQKNKNINDSNYNSNEENNYNNREQLNESNNSLENNNFQKNKNINDSNYNSNEENNYNNREQLNESNNSIENNNFKRNQNINNSNNSSENNNFPKHEQLNDSNNSFEDNKLNDSNNSFENNNAHNKQQLNDSNNSIEKNDIEKNNDLNDSNNSFEKDKNLDDSNNIIENNNNLNNNKNIYNDNLRVVSDEDNKPNELKVNSPTREENLENNNLSPVRANISNKKIAPKKRINRSRKLGVINKNKKDNEEKNNIEINDNQVIKTPNKNQNRNNLENGNGYIENNEKDSNNNNENEKNINNFDEMPIKGMTQDDEARLSEQNTKKNNIINIDDLPIKGVVNYDTNKSNQKKNKQPEVKKIINIDDLPIKGVVDYNKINEKDNKRNNNIIDIDKMPIKGTNNYNFEEQFKEKNKKDNTNEEENKYSKSQNMVIEIDTSDFKNDSKKNKKNRISRKNINKDSKNIKKDPFENFEIKVKEPPKAEENKVKNIDESNNNNEEKEENDTEKDKDKEKEKESFDEMKFQSIRLILGEEIVDFISSNKWEEKKQGYELILNLINKDIIEPNYINDLYNYIKFKLKNFKETNFNINKEALNIFIAIGKKGMMPRNLLMSLIMAYYEKISDLKLKDNILELIDTNIKANGPESLVQELIKKLLKKNNPKILIEYSNLFGKILSDDPSISSKMPYKELIDYSKYMANNNNPLVRTASTQLICTLYKTYGTSVKTAIKDIKESTLKIIEAELDKIELSPAQNLTNKAEQSKINQTDDSKENGEVIPTDNKIPQDISKKITKELLKDIEEGKWTEKKDAVEKIEKIIADTNMKILPTGLNELFDVIKSKLSDCNKNLVKILISLLSKLIESLKQNFKTWSKNIALSLIPNLADKSPAIRNECLNCFDKWVEYAGIETLVVYFPQCLKTDNVESRIEIMKFIEKYHSNLSKNLGEYVYKELADPLLLCLQDRTNNVRAKAEDIIKLSFNYIPISMYYKKIKDFKPAIADDLNQIMNRLEVSNNPLENKSNENGNDKKNIIDNNHKNNAKKKNNTYIKSQKKEKSGSFQNTTNNENISKDKIENNNLKRNLNFQNINNNKSKKANKNKKKDQRKSGEELGDNQDNINIKRKRNKSKPKLEIEDEEESENEEENENEEIIEKKKKKIIKNMRKRSKSFNSEGNSDTEEENENESNEEPNYEDDLDYEHMRKNYETERENGKEENNEERKKKTKNSLTKTKNIVKKEKKNKNINEGGIKVNKLQNKPNKKREKSPAKRNNKKKMNNYSANIDLPNSRRHSDGIYDDVNINNLSLRIKPKIYKDKNLMLSEKTRNNGGKNKDKKKFNMNNKSISVYKLNSGTQNINPNSHVKKKVNSGKSKQAMNIISKGQFLFPDDYHININNMNNLNNNNIPKRKVSNSVNNRIIKKDKRMTKSMEKKPVKKKPLDKYSKVFLMSNRLTTSKNKRYELDKKYKFNINNLSKDDFKQIKEISEQLFTEEFLKKMLNQDFLKQIDALMEMKQNLDKSENIQVYLDNFDIILKLITIKIHKNYNPAIAKALCEFLESLFNIVNETEYKMTDIEINIIFALLMDKLQINNMEIYNQIIYLMKQYISLFDANKIVMQILNMSLLSNNKIKTGVLDFILDLNQNENFNICNKNFIRVFSLFLHCNDNEVKFRLFDLFRSIYDTIGEELWNLNDVIGQKEQKYLKTNLFKGQKMGIKERNKNEENEEEENENIENEDDNNNDEEEERNINYDEEHDLKYKVYPQKLIRNSKNINKSNIYTNQFEKYEKDSNTFKSNIFNKNQSHDNNNANLDSTQDRNNDYNESNNSLKFDETSVNNNTFESKNYENQNSYSIVEKADLNKQNKKNPTKNSKRVVISKNSSTNKNPKKVYDNSLNIYKNTLNLIPEVNNNNNNITKNQPVEKIKNQNNNNQILSHSSSTENISSEKELFKILNNLSSEDESEKLNTIIIVHEILCTKYEENKYILIPCIDNIIRIFIKITHELFDVDNIENISVKYAKYLVTILCKVASNKELITHMSYKILHNLTYELLNYLLISNLDKIGENQEGNIIFKSLNSAMLRILENCDTTSVILVLLEIIKENQIKKDYNLSNLAIKCLIKITQNLNEIINNIQFDKILLQMHLILINYDNNINNIEIKTETDIMTVKFIKNFIIDVVKIKRHNVLQDYSNSVKNHKMKDKHILNWIKNTLMMIKNIESNKQIINDNISKSSINKTFSEDEENENENEENDKSQFSNGQIENKAIPKAKEEKSEIRNTNIDSNTIMNRMMKNNTRRITSNKTNATIDNKKKDDFFSIIERIKILKQNLKENNNINFGNNNNSKLNRKKSIEISKKNSKK